MRRWTLTLFLAGLLCFPVITRAQAVVIDPSQIAASAVNAADQLDYMFDQLGELAHLGDQMNPMREHINNVFGEDGIGGKTISLLQDLGTLQRLTESYNSTMKMTEMYARQMKEMEDNLSSMEKVMEVEVQATIMAEGLNDFMDVVDRDLSSQEYVSAKQGYGSQQGAASGSLGVISLILGLLGIASCALGYHLFVSGGIAGDPTSEQVFIRIGEAFLAATVTINIIASLFHINL